MASDAANMDDSTAQIQQSYATKDYKITLHLTTNGQYGKSAYNNTDGWMLGMEFRCHDLLQIMREGLFWTTSNVVPDGGYITGTKKGIDAKWQRVWELREFADQEESQCRWVATATLYSHSWKTLADFRLHTLRQQNVASSGATNKKGYTVFVYNRSPGQENINCFVDNLHPRYGSWWFWPMDAIIDYDTLSYRDGGKIDADTKTGDWSLI